MDVGMSAMYTPELFENIWRLHVLNGFDFIRVKMNSFGCDNESKVLATLNSQERLCHVHL